MDSASLKAVGLMQGPTLKHDPWGRPLLIAMPHRIEAMEQAAPLLFGALRRLSVEQLKMLRATPEFKPLLDALVVVREIMGERS